MKAWFAEACDHENRHIFPTDLEPALGHCFRKSQAINTLLQLIKLLSVSLSPHVRTAVHVGTFFFSSNTDTQRMFPVKKATWQVSLDPLVGPRRKRSFSRGKKPSSDGPLICSEQLGFSLVMQGHMARYDGEYGRDTFSPNVCSGTREIPPHF